MMTDAEQISMRGSVRGMPLGQAAALPIYDSIRGLMTGGMPAEQYFAITDGAVPGPHVQTADEARSEAARDHMIHQLNNSWMSPLNDNRAPLAQSTRDGRPMSQLPEHERAREQRIIDQSNAWKGDR